MFKKIKQKWRSRVKPFAEKGHPLPTLEQPRSQLCTENQFRSDVYQQWCREIAERPRLHRKQWEFVYILQVLGRCGKLEPGQSGIGFGVGQEPLSAIFARHGCRIVATDMEPHAQKTEGWAKTNQHAACLDQLNDKGLCDQELFEKLVSFRAVDMNHIPEDLQQRQFDFTWSACALEHLGSIDKGRRFIFNSLKCLKPGGVAVHTTEYNVTSNRRTVDDNGTVLFRRRDIEAIVEQAGSLGIDVRFNPNYGDGELDVCCDLPPYREDRHLKLLIGHYVSTSLGLILRLPS